MNAGRKDQLITLQSKVATRDAYGGEVITWTDFAERWAEVTPVAGREYVSMRQGQSDYTTRMVIYWMPNVLTNMRVIWDGVPYRITDIIPTGPRWAMELELGCVAEQTEITTEGSHG